MSHNTILIIEDDLAVSDSMKIALELEGFKVETAQDGREGLISLKQKLPCLILLDLMMPGMNGWQFLDIQQASPDYREIPVVICSAYNASARAVSLSRGAIAKPIQLDQLIQVAKTFCQPVT